MRASPQVALSPPGDVLLWTYAVKQPAGKRRLPAVHKVRHLFTCISWEDIREQVWKIAHRVFLLQALTDAMLREERCAFLMRLTLLAS